MIDIQPHLNKLDRLKEYMDAVVDYGSNPVWFDKDYKTFVFKPRSKNIEEILYLFSATGMLISNNTFLIDNNIVAITFEEYLQLNN